MKKKVLVLSEKMAEIDRLEDAYKTDESFEVTTVYSAKEAVSLLKEDSSKLLVFNLRNFSTKKLEAAVDLRNLGIEFPVLSLASQVQESAYKEVRKLDSAVLLEKPFRDDELLTISSKMSLGQDVFQRMFPRYHTDEKAYVSMYPRGDVHEVRLCDLSKGGAKVEISSLIDFKVGDLLKINVYLSALKKNHSFTAKVLWRDDSSRPGCNLLGLRYISDIELFKSLLSAS